MTLQIPWWGKLAAKIILVRLPLGYAVWQRLGLFRHGQMDTSQYAIRVFNYHAEKAGLTNQLHGKTVVELGPGDSIASAIIAATHGAHSILVDTDTFVRSDISSYHELAHVLTKQGLHVPDLSTCTTIDELLACCGAQYMTKGLASLAQITSESVDMIFSQAVLEHIRKREFRAMMTECNRILRRNGCCSHQVDLRDHLGGALNNLRFSDRVWESQFFASSGFYTNRIRYSHMLDIFNEAGFKAEVSGVYRWDALPTPIGKLSNEFKNFAVDDLCVSMFDVILRRKR